MLYDEINRIKSEGSPYEQRSLPSQRTVETFAPWIFQDTSIAGRIGGDPFVGDRVDSDFGGSRFDRRLDPNQVLYGPNSLEHLRSIQQSSAEKIGLGLVKMVGIAGTTFADAFIGTAGGLANVMFGSYDEESDLSR